MRDSQYYNLELLLHNTVAAKLHEMEDHGTQLRVMTRWVRELVDEWNSSVAYIDPAIIEPHIKRLAALLDSLDASSSQT